MFARIGLRREWHLRLAMLIIMFGVLGCAVVLEQRALIGSALGVYWVMSQVVTLALSYDGRRHERGVGGRVYPGVAEGTRGRARRGRLSLSPAGGADVPAARPPVPRNLYRPGYRGAPYAGARSHGR